MAVVELAHEPGVAVRMGMLDLELDLFLDRAVAVDLDDSARPRLGDHDPAIGEWLERMDLDRLPRIAVLLGRVVGPDNLVGGGINLGDHRRAFCIRR